MMTTLPNKHYSGHRNATQKTVTGEYLQEILQSQRERYTRQTLWTEPNPVAQLRRQCLYVVYLSNFTFSLKEVGRRLTAGCTNDLSLIHI